jgi:hypothetical protein
VTEQATTTAASAPDGRWFAQTPMSDPGPSPLLDRLPTTVGDLFRAAQGTLIHLEWISAYGLSVEELQRASRQTLSLSERLRVLADGDPRPLVVPRPPKERSPGTCRDYALMLCGLLRYRGVQARVRCGFAAYFREPWEDHWICEYRLPGESRWRRADAQLDEVLVAHLGIAFDPTDLPQEMFITADEAWRRCRAGNGDPATFGHGAICGLWFMRVNVMRDHLVLNDAEVSAWDSWRDAGPKHHVLSDDELKAADDIAADPAQAIRPISPPWIA